MQKPKISALVIALKSPVIVGIYKDNVLIQTIQSEDMTSDALPKIFDDILDKYSLENLYYANGPGSYMSIKLTFIFLRTLAIIHDIKLFASSAFGFCDNQPIKALGKKYFVLVDGDIELQTIEPVLTEFTLPQNLLDVILEDNYEPNYVLPAV